MDLHPYRFCQASTASLRMPKLLSLFFHRLLPQHWMTPFTAGGLLLDPLLGYVPWRPLTYVLPQPGIVPVYLCPGRPEEPRAAATPSRRRSHKSESTDRVITSTWPVWEAGAACSGGLGGGHRGAFLTLPSLPRGQGVEERQGGLLRKKDLGLTLTETGLQEPARAGGVGRAQGHSANKLCVSEAGRLGRPDGANVIIRKARILLAGGQCRCSGSWIPAPTVSKNVCDVVVTTSPP